MFQIHYHGKHSGERYHLTAYHPLDVYDTINMIGTKDNLVFDFVEMRE